MKSYKTKPVIVQQLFDAETYEQIIRFMEDWVPLIRLDSDRSEPDSPGKFGRRYAHNLGFFVDIHYQLSEYASELFSTKVKPSYVFLSMYDRGGNCPLHIDRPQCRYTIDYLIRQEQKKPWPIAIGPEMSDAERDSVTVQHPSTKEEIESVIKSVDWTIAELKPNDAVCYSGTNSWHYRPEPSQGKADLVFFHFVPEAFRGSLN